jgi:DNA-binding transcriptional ArsR family regulator
MGKADSVEGGDGRLSARMAAMLEPKLRDALDHPVRRELLRALSQDGRAKNVTELGADLGGFRLSQIGYHLQVLRRSGSVVSTGGPGIDRNRPRYASQVAADGQVRAVLRATERWDRERREAALSKGASPLLTMFRVPRPTVTIRLRGRREMGLEPGR